MKERYCKRCDQTLPIEAFNRHRDGYQWWCRECFRSYFRERGALHLQQVRASVEARKLRAHTYVLDHLSRHPCVDCGEADPVVLEFDHVGRKSSEVAALVAGASPIAAIKAEIDLCEVVCCNCHRRRTLLWQGCERGRQESIERQKPFIRRNLRWIYDLLASSACGDCGLRDDRVLEFDHVGPKRGGVMKMAWEGYGFESLKAEVAQCEIRCANCHRRKTASSGRHFRARATLQT